MPDNKQSEGQPDARRKRGDRDWPRDPDEDGPRDLQRERERTEGRGGASPQSGPSRTRTQEEKDIGKA